jgi:NAD(P)-dependent dehydrogenase (short-subunit alcohol dehydrogenase family)
MGASSSKQCKYYSEFEAKLPDLNQKVVAVTGCTSGTGLVLAKACVRKNCATVLMLNRESERATAAEKAVKAEVKDSQQCQVVTVPCDLQDFESVQKAADLIKQKYDAIDVLCK